MSRQTFDAIDRQIGAELSADEKRRPCADDDHRSVELSAYLDGALRGSRRERVETHLAVCDGCRELVIAAGSAVREADSSRQSPLRSWAGRWQPLLALAAASVAAVVGVNLFRGVAPTASERLLAAGVSAADVEAAGPEIRARALAALAGEWRQPAGFELFLSAGDRPALRGASTVAAPVPIEPRWSVVDSFQPRLAWRPRVEAEQYELLVVDEDERLVTAFAVDAAPRAGGEIAIAYPASLPPLVAGRAYAWKVNARIGDEWAASAYVPFRLASAADKAALERDLGRAGADRLLRAVALASSGRYRHALELLRELKEPERSRLVGSLLERQHFSARELEHELEIWTRQASETVVP